MKEYIKTMLSSSDEVSSKRVGGIMCLIVYFLIFISSYFIILSEIQISMANGILYVGATLLGATAIEKIFKK